MPRVRNVHEISAKKSDDAPHVDTLYRFNNTGTALPKNVLRRIFSLAASPSVHTSSSLTAIQIACNLALVSTYAEKWMRPFIWRTVNLVNPMKIHQIRNAFHAQRSTSGSFVRNLWIRAETTGRPLREEGHVLARELAIDRPRNLAIDLTLVVDGWLERNDARPTQVLLLAPTRPTPSNRHMLGKNPRSIFKRVTHVIVEPHWHELKMTPGRLNTLFPSMKALCVRIPADLDPEVAAKCAHKLFRTKRLEVLIMCIDNGANGVLSVDNANWVALRNLASDHDNLTILPEALPIRSEWDAIVANGNTVWRRAENPAWGRTEPTFVEDQDICLDDESIPPFRHYITEDIKDNFVPSESAMDVDEYVCSCVEMEEPVEFLVEGEVDQILGDVGSLRSLWESEWRLLSEIDTEEEDIC
ncbi:uncharacterized protein LAESUDRAFT_809516 [Laetiporus sulphureus 93-53]|uniref:Uncharacterized protein n=1 Tax=Laetiporus sulphureus 93-53 TaxID=1314785 RepID=A0A165HED3_9APHY|nr:uncharacterized protein LAESUDRAFT_809516 [Laetiporus sulphureus 93-53]KZT11626.1 hypothetical protein LAESUDRAFT_809516 [Laetiporus sulphureus 93-53]